MKKYLLCIILLITTTSAFSNKIRSFSSSDTTYYVDLVAKEKYMEEKKKDSIELAKKPIVIAHLNHYLNIIHSLKQNKDLQYLYYVQEELEENISYENNNEELKTLRTEIFKAAKGLEINKRERDIYKQIRHLTEKNQKMVSLNNALSSMSYLITTSNMNGSGATTNIVKGASKGVAVATAAAAGTTAAVAGGAAIAPVALAVAVPTILILARSGVDYVASQRELEKSEILEEWKFTKEELKLMEELSITKMDAISNLSNIYNITGDDRIRDNLLDDFYSVLSDSCIQNRINKFTESDSKKYEIIPDYYYYLGMDYVSVGDYDKAKPLFDKYHELSDNIKLLQNNEKLGLIAMVQIAYESDEKEIDKLANKITEHLPNNEMGYLACIYKYLELGNLDKAYNTLSLGLKNITEQNDILVEFAMRNINSIKNHEKYSNIYRYILNYDHISLSYKLICEYLINGQISSPHEIFEITDGSWYNFNICSSKNCVLAEDTIEITKSIGVNHFPYKVEQNFITREDLVNKYDELEDMNEKDCTKFLSYFYTPIDREGERFITRRNLPNEKNKFTPQHNKDSSTDQNYVYTDLTGLLGVGNGDKNAKFIEKFYNDACKRHGDATKIKAISEKRIINWVTDLRSTFHSTVSIAMPQGTDSTMIGQIRIANDSIYQSQFDNGKEYLNIVIKTHDSIPDLRFRYLYYHILSPFNAFEDYIWCLQSIHYIHKDEEELLYSPREW